MSDALTVSKLVNSVKYLLENEYAQVSVIGEVSNLSRSSAGHIYFTLSDPESGLSAVLFRADALRNSSVKDLKDGDKIICHGGLSVYGKRGTFQLIVRRLEPAGAGDLKLRYEKLKRDLAAQGLFDHENKKQIPSYPKRVALITAEGGAALWDFVNVYRRRAVTGEVILIPAVVQGDQSAVSLRKALAKAIKLGIDNPDKAFDVIVLTRGGGSMEDLWSFNDEGLAWDIFNCPIPVISAVGHQVDYSICDFVSDLRAETPTAAAQLLTQEQSELATHLKRFHSELLHAGTRLSSVKKQKIERASPEKLVRILKQRSHDLSVRLRECYLGDRIERLTGFGQKSLRLDDLSRRIEGLMDSKIQDYTHRIDRDSKMLEALNPKSVLGRGYAYVTDSESHVIASSKKWNELDQEKTMQLHFSDGAVTVRKGK